MTAFLAKPTIRWCVQECLLSVGPHGSIAVRANGRNRRYLAVGARVGEGPKPFTISAVRHSRREGELRQESNTAAMLAGIPVKERVRICNDGTADSRRRRACQDL